MQLCREQCHGKGCFVQLSGCHFPLTFKPPLLQVFGLSEAKHAWGTVCLYNPCCDPACQGGIPCPLSPAALAPRRLWESGEDSATGEGAQSAPFHPTEPSTRGITSQPTAPPGLEASPTASSWGSELLRLLLRSATRSTVPSPPGILPGRVKSQRSGWRCWLSGQHNKGQARGVQFFPKCPTQSRNQQLQEETGLGYKS